MSDAKTENGDLLEFIQAHYKPEVFFDTAKVIALPTGMRLESTKKLFDQWRRQPERKVGFDTVTDIASFQEHWNSYSGDAIDGSTRPVLFCDQNEDSPRMIAVYNYHSGSYLADAGWCDYGAIYPFPVSPQWRTWQGASRGKFDVRDFAVFLRENIADLVSPTSEAIREKAEALAAQNMCKFAEPTDIYALADGLEVVEKTTIRDKRKLQSGEMEISFESRHEGKNGGSVNVPSAFLIAIPVLDGRDAKGELHKSALIPVHLMYRIDDRTKEVRWQLQPHRMDLAFRRAIRECAEDVRNSLQCRMFYGKPADPEDSEIPF